MVISLRVLILGVALCAVSGFADAVELEPQGSNWELRKEFAYWADDARGNRYLFAVNRELVNLSAGMWTATMTVFGSKTPDFFVWLDAEHDFHNALKLENGDVKIADFFKFEAIPDVGALPYGIVRATLWECVASEAKACANERLVAARDFHALLVPVPGRNCTARSKEKNSWRANGNEVGAIEYWDCRALVAAEDSAVPESGTVENMTGGTTQIIGFHAEGEVVFQIWNAGGKTFAALTLDNRHRVATEVLNGVSSWYFDIYKKPLAVTIELYVGGIDGTRFQRVIKFRAQ